MYLLERFGDITLPIGNVTQTLSVVPSQLAFVDTTSGIFDNDGWARSRQAFPLPLRYQALVNESSMTANRILLDSLRAAVGTRNNLYRRARDDGDVHYALCRLSGMNYDTNQDDKAWRTISLEFQQIDRWHGALHGTGWRFDTGIVLDTGRILDEDPPVTLNINPKTLAVVNNGNLPVRNMQLILTVGATPITKMTITASHAELILTNIPAASGVVIDTGAWSITRNGDNFYSALTLGPDHAQDTWLELAPGTSAITFLRVGGDNTNKVALIFTDEFA